MRKPSGKGGRVRPAPRRVVFKWPASLVGKATTTDVIQGQCQFCKKRALTVLPPQLLKKQPDRTNVICNPFLGGCNHGFEMAGLPVNKGVA